MQVKNLSQADVSFMFQSSRGTKTMPLFETVNIISGWTVVISDHIWDKIKTQTTSIAVFAEEVVTIEAATMKDMNGKSYHPTRTDRIYSHSKEVNLVEHLVETGVLKVVKGNGEAPLPDRKILEAFLKRFGEKGVDKLSDEDVIIKVRELKAELAAVDSV